LWLCHQLGLSPWGGSPLHVIVTFWHSLPAEHAVEAGAWWQHVYRLATTRKVQAHGLGCFSRTAMQRDYMVATLLQLDLPFQPATLLSSVQNRRDSMGHDISVAWWCCWTLALCMLQHACRLQVGMYGLDCFCETLPVEAMRLLCNKLISTGWTPAGSALVL
jgi:hypothetical protein